MITAYTVHESPGRWRLRIPQKRGDASFFRRLAAGLGHCPGMHRVVGNPLTASLLLCFGPPLSVTALDAELVNAGLSRCVKPAKEPPRPLLDHAVAGRERIDDGLKRLSAGRLDLNSTVFLIFSGLAIRQTLEGQIAVPALSLAWYALTLLDPRKPPA